MMDTIVRECNICGEEWDCDERTSICVNCSDSGCVDCEYKNGCNFKDCRKFKCSHV